MRTVRFLLPWVAAFVGITIMLAEPPRHARASQPRPPEHIPYRPDPPHATVETVDNTRPDSVDALFVDDADDE